MKFAPRIHLPRVVLQLQTGLILGFFALFAGTVQARILVYENFNYGTTSIPMSNLATPATGLKASYSVEAAGGGTSTYMPTGLTFSSNFYPTTDGCLRQSAPAAGSYALLGVALQPGTPAPCGIQPLAGTLPVTGTPLYSSYLARFNSFSNAADAGAVLQISNTQLGGGTAWFAVEADSRTALKRPGVGYDGTPTAAASGTLAANTTYLVVTRFTNVGEALGAAALGVANTWVFTAAGYDSWFNAGALESQLSSYAAFAATESIASGTFNFDNTRFMQFRVEAGTGGSAQTVDFDELRMGTSLGDVAPGVPFFPDGALPVTLIHHMPATWDLTTVSHKLWVAQGGTGNGAAPGNALGSIQAAIDQATPGTAILVQAGTYAGPLTINSTVSGTDASPILIVSADGVNAAAITSTGEVSTITGSKSKNIGLIGFQVMSGANGTDSDSSAIKFGSTDANSNTCYNWFIAGNNIGGTGTDGMKTYKSRNVYWFGNTVNGATVTVNGAAVISIKEEACDNVIVGVLDPARDNNQFAFNTTLGITSYSSITMKMGANHYLVFNNDFSQQTWTSVRVGGDGGLKPHLTANQFPTNDPDYASLTASNIQVLHNHFRGPSVTRNIQLYGAVNSTVSFNQLWDPAASNFTREISDEPAQMDVAGDTSPETFPAAYNTVSDNKIFSATENAFKVWGGAGGLTSTALATYTIQRNSSAEPFSYPTGATVVRPLIDGLIQTLRNGATSPLYFDDYSDGNSNGWTPVAGTWSVVMDGSKVYQQSATGGNASSTAGSLAWCNYELSAKVRPLTVGANGSFGLNARYADSSNFYSFRYLSSAGTLQIVKTMAGVTTILQSKPYAMVSGITYTLKAVLNGSILEFYVNGEKELTVVDNTFPTGKIALDTFSSTAQFDEILVTPTKAPLIYEPFGYAVPSGTTMNGVSSNATGLTGSFNVLNNGGTSTFHSSGLTFSSKFLPVSGGCLRLSAPAAGNYALLGVQLQAGTTFGTPLYGSYLVRFNSLSSALDAGALVQVGSVPLTGGSVWFNAEADSRLALQRPGVSYDGTPTTAASGALAVNTTYLVVTRFTNVGKVLSTSLPGVADTWVFTAADYDNWRNAGAVENQLSSHASFSVTDSVTSGSTYSFNNTRFLQLRVTAGTGGTAQSVDFDELRFGGNLDAILKR